MNVLDVRYSVFESLIRSLGSRRLELHRKFPKAESLKVGKERGGEEGKEVKRRGEKRGEKMSGGKRRGEEIGAEQRRGEKNGSELKKEGEDE